jgi:anaerobic magnesium-protoporphyrin IX monomethyl ester cyclase
MFGVESGCQRVLDGMHKKTKLCDIEHAIRCASNAGIGIVHAFFIVGSPDETEEEVTMTFDFAGRVPVNSFNFNSLTAFRGTPLWTDAIEKGLIDDEKDWDKMFPVHAIYPSAIPSKDLFKLRARLVRRLIRRKILRHPLKAVKIIHRFLSCMSARDIYKLLNSSKKGESYPHA